MKGILSKSVVFSVDIQIVVLTVTISGDAVGRTGGHEALIGLAQRVGVAGIPMIAGTAVAMRAGRRAEGADAQVDASRCSYQVGKW